MTGLLGSALREPPHNIAAEQALLGALLANNRAFDRVGHFLREEHFADAIHGRIFAAIAQRIEAGRLVDAVTLKAEFEHTGVLDAAGGTQYLAQLLGAMVGIINAGEYGHAIYDAWLRRQLIDIGETIVNNAFASTEGFDAKAQIEAAEQKLFDLAERGDNGEACSPAHEAMDLAITAAVKAANQPGGLVGLTTGYRALDDITGGLRRGQYSLIGARPSMGKTTLALGIAAGAAAAGARVLFVSKEMTCEAIGALLSAGLGNVARDGAERGRIRGRDEFGRFTWAPINQAEIDRMLAAQRAMATRTLMIDECRAGTMAAIRSAARRMKRRGGLDLVVIDYIGLLRVPELMRFDNRTLELTRLSSDCKGLAVDLDVPLLALSQLSRDLEKRDDKRPELSDLRDSGSLEQDADLVGFLYRENYYLARSEPVRKPGETDEKFSARMSAWTTAELGSREQADLFIRKQRRGRIGRVGLRFNQVTTWFTDTDQETN
jgi:replicative DNA helicase